MELLRNWEPAVDRRWHHGLAGVLWSGVGLMLCSKAREWGAGFETPIAIACAGAGVLGAGLTWRLGFGRLALRNIARLDAKAGRFCVFAFLSWRSYLIIPVMIGMGVLLRFGLPKEILVPVYVAIGGGLFLASLSYYRRLLAAG